jgi:hypothetical protein
MSFSTLSGLVRNTLQKQLPVTQNLYGLDDWWEMHKFECIKNWYWYFGRHALFMRQYDGERQSDYLKRVQTATIENQIKPIIDLEIAYLYPVDSPKRYIQRNEEVDADLMTFMKQNVWNYKRESVLDDKKALNTLVTGFSVLQRQLMDMRTNKLFVLADDGLTKVKYGKITKRVLDSCFTAAIPYIDENNVAYPDRLGAVIYIADQDNYIGNAQVMKLLGRELKQYKICEIVTDDIWLRWVKDENSNKDWVQQNTFVGTEYQNRNPFGDVNIPFTVYPNTGDPFLVEGESEVSGLSSINNELNELGSGDSEVIGYHQNPILHAHNIKLPDGFVRRKNTVLESEGKDAKLEYVIWDGKLESSEARQKSLRQVMSNVSAVSLLSRGFLSEIGQIRSGPPLKAMFNSERSMMSRKFKYFSDSECRDMQADIKFWEKSTGANLKIDKTVSFHADFDKDFLGIDELLNKEIAVAGVQGGVDDIKENLYAEHPDKTEAEINEIYQRILKNKQSGQQNKQSQQRSDLNKQGNSAE